MIPQLIGTAINKYFVGMTKEKMHLYKYLVYIQIVSQLISFLTIQLIPIQKDLDEYVKVFDELELEQAELAEPGEPRDANEVEPE